MKSHFLVLVALMGSAAACSDSSGSSSAAAGSCAVTSGATSFCAQYGSGVSVASARADCTGTGGSYATNSCSATNRIARCVVPGNIGGVQTNSTVSFYAPTTDTDARQVCTMLGGTYTAG